MKLCTAMQEGCGYKNTLGLHRYIAPLAKYFTVCITYQPPLVCVCVCVCVYIYICVYICIYIHIYIHISNRPRFILSVYILINTNFAFANVNFWFTPSPLNMVWQYTLKYTLILLYIMSYI